MGTMASLARPTGCFRKDGIMGAVLGLVIFIADLWAIIKTLQSSVTAGNKLLWVLIILLLPVLGLILWFFLGLRTAGDQ